MGVFANYKKKKQEEHEKRLKEIDEFNFEAFCKQANVSKEDGKILVENNIANGKSKYFFERKQ